MSPSTYRVIGSRVPKVGASDMVQGKALYAADVALPGMLHGAVLRSPHAHARIRLLDATPALGVDGVAAVITAADFPPLKPGATFPLGEVAISLEGVATLVIAQEKALFHGHTIAAVAASSPAAAQEALRRIRVEYEALPPVMEVEEAMKEDSPLLDPQVRTKDVLGSVISERPSNVAMRAELVRGDVDQGFHEAEVIIEEEYRVDRAHQGYLEPHACVARVEPDGRATVWASTQGSFTLQLQLAGLLGLPLRKVRVVPMEVGGAFGGKIYTVLEPLALLLARKSGRPVKLALTREEVLRVTGPGVGGVFRVRSGCRRDGGITALDVRMALDAGCVPGAPVAHAIRSMASPYAKVPHVRMVALDVLTNKPRVTPYRAPTGPQTAFALEQNIEAMATAIGMDPAEFRSRNAAEEGDLEGLGRPFNRIGFREVLQQVREHPHWRAPLGGPHRGRGMAAGYLWGVQWTSSAHVTLHRDGTASLTVGSVDLTGTRTALLQMAAEELGLDPDQVSVQMADTDSVGYTDLSGGSRTTYATGVAVYRACHDALQQLRERAARRLQIDPDLVEYEEGRFSMRDNPDKGVSLAELTIGAEGAVVGRGSVSRLQPASSFCAGVADVEVDPETGKVRLLRYTSFQDVGCAINPAQIEGQNQGGVAQGMGWALQEALVYDREGVLCNPTLLDYRQPVSLDMPYVEVALVEVPAAEGPYGARAVGEAPIIHPPAAIANAIYAATGVRLTRMPMTAERLFRALRSRRE